MADRLICVLGDITRERAEAIVNAANGTLRGGGGVDGAIHRAAGSGLLAECVEKYPEGCPTGQARLTAGHELDARFVIHTVGPVYRDGRSGEPALLASCYRESLALAAGAGVTTVSFPAISCGVYGYPPEAAARVAVRAIREGLERHPGLLEVRMVLFSESHSTTFQAAVAADPALRRGSAR